MPLCERSDLCIVTKDQCRRRLWKAEGELSEKEEHDAEVAARREVLSKAHVGVAIRSIFRFFGLGCDLTINGGSFSDVDGKWLSRCLKSEACCDLLDGVKACARRTAAPPSLAIVGTSRVNNAVVIVD